MSQAWLRVAATLATCFAVDVHLTVNEGSQDLPQVGGALYADDACFEEGGDEACSLNALQARGLRLHQPAPGAADLDADAGVPPDAPQHSPGLEVDPSPERSAVLPRTGAATASERPLAAPQAVGLTAGKDWSAPPAPMLMAELVNGTARGMAAVRLQGTVASVAADMLQRSLHNSASLVLRLAGRSHETVAPALVLALLLVALLLLVGAGLAFSSMRPRSGGGQAGAGGGGGGGVTQATSAESLVNDINARSISARGPSGRPPPPLPPFIRAQARARTQRGDGHQVCC